MWPNITRDTKFSCCGSSCPCQRTDPCTRRHPGQLIWYLFFSSMHQSMYKETSRPAKWYGPDLSCQHTKLCTRRYRGSWYGPCVSFQRTDPCTKRQPGQLVWSRYLLTTHRFMCQKTLGPADMVPVFLVNTPIHVPGDPWPVGMVPLFPCQRTNSCARNHRSHLVWFLCLSLTHQSMYQETPMHVGMVPLSLVNAPIHIAGDPLASWYGPDLSCQRTDPCLRRHPGQFVWSLCFDALE